MPAVYVNCNMVLGRLGGKEEWIRMEADTVGDVIRKLTEDSTLKHLLYEIDGKKLPQFIIIVNDKPITEPRFHEVKLREGDRLRVMLPAMGG